MPRDRHDASEHVAGKPPDPAFALAAPRASRRRSAAAVVPMAVAAAATTPDPPRVASAFVPVDGHGPRDPHHTAFSSGGCGCPGPFGAPAHVQSEQSSETPKKYGPVG
jgi:hypothetical protein